VECPFNKFITITTFEFWRVRRSVQRGTVGLKPRRQEKNTRRTCRGRGLTLSLLLIGQIQRGSVFWLVITFFLTITSIICGFNFNNFHQQLFYFTSTNSFNMFFSLLVIKMLFPVNPAPPTRVHMSMRASLPVPSLPRVWSETGRTCPSAPQSQRCRRRPCPKPSPAHRWRMWRTACCCSRLATHG